MVVTHGRHEGESRRPGYSLSLFIYKVFFVGSQLKSAFLLCKIWLEISKITEIM